MSHAFLSPSSAHRGFNCPASVNRSDIIDRRVEMMREIGPEFYGLSEEKSSQFRAVFEDDEDASSDGTALHKAFEDCLVAKVTEEKTIRMLIDTCGASDKILEDEFVVSRMIEVCKYYVDFCNQEGFERSVEKRVKVKGLPQFGTVDLATRSGRTLGVHDLKTGRNEVQAENNYQLLCYASGLLDEYGWDNFDDVYLEIIGVRFSSNNVTVPVEEVKRFKFEVMLPAFMDAYSVNPTVKPGKWCQYCSAKLYCKEWLEKNNKAFDNVFMDDMTEKTNEELEEIYYSFKELEQLVKNQVNQELLSRFDTFNEPKGVKRVSGNKIVKWRISDKEVEKTLAEFVEPDTLYKRSLKTPKQIQSLLGERAEIVEDLVTTVIGKPYLKKL